MERVLIIFFTLAGVQDHICNLWIQDILITGGHKRNRGVGRSVTVKMSTSSGLFGREIVVWPFKNSNLSVLHGSLNFFPMLYNKTKVSCYLYD